MCGPSGAGKTTYARRLEGAGMVRLSFDGHLWARGIRSGEVPAIVRDEVRDLLRTQLAALLGAGQAVVLDFSFWSRAMRSEWRALAAEHGTTPETIYLATDRRTVLARIEDRRGADADDFPVDLQTAAGYVDRFEVPTPEEGPLTIVVEGEEFAVTRRAPGVYDYHWLNHRHGGYGFSSATSDHSPVDGLGHVDGIRDFLRAIDPETGFIEDDDE
ncbi:hypothetical protein GCM10009812_29830 [Nocardioides marinus]|nr:ATP-binding protein [Nocardioides marinus]